jgi:beta-xylosidase
MPRLVVAILAFLVAGWPDRAAADPPLFVPVLSVDFPDPFILPHGGEFLAYATNPERGQVNVQMAVSANLADWRMLRDGDRLHDAMPDLPAWARRGFTWAPEVLAVDGGFRLYFTARDRRSGLQCVGVASSADPRGPFVSAAAEPLVCQRELGGTIDASPFRDADGQLYLYFKNDGNNPAAHKPVRLYGQRLAADGLSLLGEPAPILDSDADWEGHLIEAPTMTRAGGAYTLFFSANDYGWQDNQRLSSYAIGYANCRGPLGPCSAAQGNPILHSFFTREAGCLSGPGHQTIFQVANRAFLAFHAWAATPGCRKSDPRRYIYISPLAWREGAPVIGVSLRPTASR